MDNLSIYVDHRFAWSLFWWQVTPNGKFEALSEVINLHLFILWLSALSFPACNIKYDFSFSFKDMFRILNKKKVKKKKRVMFTNHVNPWVKPTYPWIFVCCYFRKYFGIKLYSTRRSTPLMFLKNNIHLQPLRNWKRYQTSKSTLFTDLQREIRSNLIPKLFLKESNIHDIFKRNKVLSFWNKATDIPRDMISKRTLNCLNSYEVTVG